MEHDYQGQDASHEEEGGAPAWSAEAQQSPAPADTSEEANGMEALLRENDYAFRSLRRGETVEGTIVRVDPDEILVDVGMKSEGIIPSRELYTDPDDDRPLRVGDRALVYVMQPDGPEGPVLSLRRARMERSWRDIEDLYNRGEIVEAPVVDFNKGGLIVDVKSVRGFVPVSQVLDLRNVGRQDGDNEEVTQTLQAMNGRRLPLKIIEINRSRNRLILSERAAVQEQRTQRKDELLDQLEPGQIRRGVVSNLTSFGAFVDLGGADGLVHVSELSYNRVNHPSEVLRVGQEIDVMVLSVDRDSKKIALSVKRALPDPWTTVEQTYRVGQVVDATITKLAKFGAFAKVEEGLEGLIHLTELTDLPVQDAAQVVQEGQAVQAKIIHINSQRRRLGLSVRQAVEPQYSAQTFGAVDDTSPFADQDYGRYTPQPTSNEPLFETDLPTTGATQSFPTITLPTPEPEPETEPLAPEPGPEPESLAPAPAVGEPANESGPLEDNTAGAPDLPAAETEPQPVAGNGSTPVAAAPETAPLAEPEASLPGETDEEGEPASVGVPRSSSE